MKTRAHAAKVLFEVVEQGASLSAVLPAAQQQLAAKDRALLQELCFGSLRWLSRLEAIAAALMSKHALQTAQNYTPHAIAFYWLELLCKKTKPSIAFINNTLLQKYMSYGDSILEELRFYGYDVEEFSVITSYSIHYTKLYEVSISSYLNSSTSYP